MTGEPSETKNSNLPDLPPLPYSLAVIPVRSGRLPAGSGALVSMARGTVLLVGSCTEIAAEELCSRSDRVSLSERVWPYDQIWLWESGDFAPGSWSDALAGVDVVASAELILLPAGPDGRDLAPRLAARLGRPLVTGVTTISYGNSSSDNHPRRAEGIRLTVSRWGGRVDGHYEIDGPAVATVEPRADGIGARDGVDSEAGANSEALVGKGTLSATARTASPLRLQVPASETTCGDPEVVCEVTPDATSIDLSQAGAVLAGGGGIGDAEHFARLTEVAEMLRMSVGASRVATDAGWAPMARQIGTTGVAIRPEVYVAVGISGAVQHTGGVLGEPRVLAVNTDPYCPMMQRADVAIVCDAPAVVDELHKLLSGSHNLLSGSHDG